MIRVVVIDDGVYSINSNIFADVSYTYFLGRFIKRECGEKKTYTHGTLCAGIIKEDDIDVISIKIMTEGTGASIAILKRAIKFSYTLNPDIIHLSLGSYKWWDGHILCSVLKSVPNNTYVVASADYLGKKTYPACLENVIGICHSDYIKKNQCIVASPNASGVNVYLKTPQFFGDNFGNVVNVPSTSSFAAAYFTKWLALYIGRNSNKSIKDFYTLLGTSSNKEENRDLNDRLLVILYCGKRPRVLRNFIYFRFSQIKFVKCSNVMEGIHESLLSTPLGSRTFIVCDKSLTFSKNHIDMRIFNELISFHDVVVFANKEVLTELSNMNIPALYILRRHTLEYSIYHRILWEKKKSIPTIKEYSNFIDFARCSQKIDDVYPVTNNPLYIIYGIEYIEPNEWKQFVSNCQNSQIAWIK